MFDVLHNEQNIFLPLHPQNLHYIRMLQPLKNHINTTQKTPSFNQLTAMICISRSKSCNPALNEDAFSFFIATIRSSPSFSNVPL